MVTINSNLEQISSLVSKYSSNSELSNVEILEIASVLRSVGNVYSAVCLILVANEYVEKTNTTSLTHKDVNVELLNEIM